MDEPRTTPDAEATLQELGALARRGASGEVSPRAHSEGRARLLEAAGRAALPIARPPWRILAAAGVPALAVAAAIALWPAPPLTFALEGAPPSSGYVAAGPSGAAVQFSEGTRVSFAAGARGRVDEVTARGARVRLEEGAAHFRVTHLKGAAWSAEAGPFTIAVTGTEFDLRWQRQHLDLVMQSGSVTVSGPLAAAGIALHGGQSLVADLERGKLSILDAPPSASARGSLEAPPSAVAGAPPSALASAPSPSAPNTPSGAGGALAVDPTPSSAALPSSSAAPSSPSSSAASSSPESKAGSAALSSPSAPSLRERVLRGDFASVIAEAEARGIDASLGASSLEDLAALADAARYAGRSELAERALLAERARFPGSAEARSAAFLLGRIAEASSGAAAVAWYDRYLAESPNGSLAAEALGRKMSVVRASAGREAARAVAEEYRRRFPRGASAALAEEILAAP